jgi:hypothetical protein
VTAWEPLRRSAASIWVQLLHSSAAACLLLAYACLDRFDEILLAVRELFACCHASVCGLYPLAVSCLSDAGEFRAWRTPC